MAAPWACHLCTFENDPARTRCEMCDATRSSEEGSEDELEEETWGLLGGLVQGGRSLLNGTLTGAVAVAGATTGAIAGALAGRATDGGSFRGASLGALAGAVVSMEALEASRSFFGGGAESRRHRGAPRGGARGRGGGAAGGQGRQADTPGALEAQLLSGLLESMGELGGGQQVRFRGRGGGAGANGDGGGTVYINLGDGRALGLPRGILQHFYGYRGGGDQIDRMGYDELYERFGGHQGASGAPEEAIDAIPTRTVTAEDTCGAESTCSICLSDFERGECIRSLPTCLHTFHKGCVDRWLKDHGICPVCRQAIPGVEAT